MHPLRTATPSVDRLASILAQLIHWSVTASYTSTVRTLREPLKPPTAYTRPPITDKPALQTNKSDRRSSPELLFALSSGSSSTLCMRYSWDNNGRRTYSISSARCICLPSRSCCTQLTTHSNTFSSDVTVSLSLLISLATCSGVSPWNSSLSTTSLHCSRDNSTIITYGRMMEGWILVISYFLLVLVNGQDGINWTEANNNRKMVSATVPYCPEQPHCTPELVTETLPYIMDCRKYIYCNTDGTEKLSICPFGLHYRASDGNCVDPSVTGCPKCGTTIEATTESTTEATIESTTEATIESTTEATIEFTTETTSQISTGSTIPVCPEEPKCMPEDAYDSIPYIPDCTKYIYCSPDGNE
ncbi:hypothetical protein B566_EDAN012163, partial [Ephemera danica]